MPSKPNPSDAPAALRRRAVARLQARRKGRPAKARPQKSGAETRRAFHELEVHQIELEMQNDELTRAKTELEARVRQRTGMIRKLATELTLAEQREKSRIAHVLHDEVQQLLSGARMLLNGAGENTTKRWRATLLGRVDETLLQCIETTRTLSVELSPPVLRGEGLAAALKWLGVWMEQRHGLAVSVTVGPNQVSLPEAISVLLYQILRELLFNVVKHARVKSASVILDCLDAQVIIVVSDQGKGFKPASLQTKARAVDKFGLRSVRERLDWVGGQMEIQSAPGQGSRFTLQVPARPAARCRTKRNAKGIS